MSTAVYGYQAIEKLSKFSVPLLILLIFIALFLVIGEKGTDVMLKTQNTAFSFGTATSLVIGIFVLGTILAPDISRWARSKKDAVLSAFIGFFVGNSFMLVMAILLSKAMNTSDLIAIFTVVGLGMPAIVVLTLAQWTTNTNNLYSSSLGLAVLFPGIPKKLLTLIAGILATLVAVLGIFDQFVTFLSIVTVLIAPIGGIYAAEYYFVNKQQFRFDNEKRVSFVGRSFIVWFLASSVAFLTTDAPAGLGIFDITTIPALDGFLIALIVQTVLGKVLSKADTTTKLAEEISK